MCSSCGLYVGVVVQTCGACKKPEPLSFRELLRMGRLLKRYAWGSATSLSALVYTRGHGPTLQVADPGDGPPRGVAGRIRHAQFESMRAIGAELGDLYDRFQAQIGMPRLAVRIWVGMNMLRASVA